MSHLNMVGPIGCPTNSSREDAMREKSATGQSSSFLLRMPPATPYCFAKETRHAHYTSQTQNKL